MQYVNIMVGRIWPSKKLVKLKNTVLIRVDSVGRIYNLQRRLLLNWNRIEPIFVQSKVDLFLELSNNYLALQQQMNFFQYELRSSWYGGTTVVAVYQMVYLGYFLTIQPEMSLVLQYQPCSSSQQFHCNTYASLKYKDAMGQYDDRRDILL